MSYFGYEAWAFTDPNYAGPPYYVPPGTSGSPSFITCNGTAVFATFDVETNTMTFNP